MKLVTKKEEEQAEVTDAAALLVELQRGEANSRDKESRSTKRLDDHSEPRIREEKALCTR